MNVQRKALIIEDDIDSQLLYKFSLRIEKIEAVSMSNGRVALDYLATKSLPDIILLDLNMPIMNGTEFMFKLRENPVWDNIRVIIISSWDDLKSKSEAMGADGFLLKPFPRPALYAELERCLALPQ